MLNTTIGKDDYEIYLEKYMKTYNISREAAESHYLVKEYKKYCAEKAKIFR